ncbi:HAMP domain-containing histidine kinase [bacterium]|nr:HAMP domain-containing histidine kinase [bacterium]
MENLEKPQVNISERIEEERRILNRRSLESFALPIFLIFSILLIIDIIVRDIIVFPGNVIAIGHLIIAVIYGGFYFLKKYIKNVRNTLRVIITATFIAIILIQLQEFHTSGDVTVFIVAVLLLHISLIFVPQDAIFMGVSMILIFTAMVFLFQPAPDHILGNIINGTVSISLGVLFTSMRFRNLGKRVIAQEEVKDLNRKLLIKNKVLDESIEKIEEMNAQRTDYISNISHELKTPITILMGNLELLKNDEEIRSDPASRRLDTMDRNVKRLYDTVTDLFNFSRVDNIDKATSMEPFSLDILFSQIRDDYRDFFLENKRELNLLVSDDRYVMGNCGDISVLIENLLINAVKYSHEGSEILIKAESNGKKVRISVIDQGIGISEKDKGRIFDKFYQAEGGLSRKYGGTGLGLYIARQIAEKHKSSLCLISQEKKGSTFYFDLRAAEEGLS